MYPYQNPDLSTEERISDLMSRMTLEEKILQTDQYYSGDFTTQDENGKVTAVDMQRFDALMQHNSVGSVQLRGMTAAQANVVQRYAIENTRLGIPYLFSEEALHGLMTNNATSFPQQIGLAASFEPELGREMGHAIAAESRACGIHETYSPVMDLIRDPRYGRAEESYGEDTYLCAEFARETVLGMQGTDLTAPDAVAAEPKHYVGYGNPVGEANTQLALAIAAKIDSDCMDALQTASLIYDGTAKTISYNAIVDAVDLFEDEMGCSEKVMFIHPKQVTQLRKNPDFLSADKYTPGVALTGEIGMIAGCRLVPSKKVPLDGGIYACPIVKLEDDPEVDDEIPALTIYRKREVNIETERKPKTRTTEITADEFYVAVLSNEAKVVLAKFKA